MTRLDEIRMYWMANYGCPLANGDIDFLLITIAEKNKRIKELEAIVSREMARNFQYEAEKAEPGMMLKRIKELEQERRRYLIRTHKRIKELEEIDKWRSEGGVDPQTNKMWLTRHMEENAELLSALYKAQERIKELENVYRGES